MKINLKTKQMKKVLSLLALFTVLVLTGCTHDDDCMHEIETVEIHSIAYDSQDNVLKIDNTGDWLQSMDWNTYVDEYNWEGANPYFGVRHDWNTKGLRVVSDTYEITGAVIEDIYTSWEIIDGALYIEVPTMQTYMNDTDLYYFKVKVRAVNQ